MFHITAQAAAIAAEIARIQHKVADLRPLLDAIGARLEMNAHLRFDLKRDPEGIPWDPWSAETAEKRKKEGRGTLLEYTGMLRSGTQPLLTNDTVEVGFDASYAPYVDRKGRRLLLTEGGAIGAADEASIDRIFAAYL